MAPALASSAAPMPIYPAPEPAASTGAASTASRRRRAIIPPTKAVRQGRSDFGRGSQPRPALLLPALLAGCCSAAAVGSIDALDEISPLDEQHCRPCRERRADAWCECDDAADQGWGDVCAACVLSERWCVACAAISAARVALLFRTRGARRLRAIARKHAKESVYAGHPWRPKCEWLH
jgi:hypothetical protein